jgi:surface carbohydrate biosynthesis protein (TIGR04326 family)
MDNQMIDSITIWDSNEDTPKLDELIYTWNGYEEKGSVRSLLGYVESHGERLREKYLAWVHDLGESQKDGKRLIDHLTFEDGFSYWWMTSFVEKNFWKSPSIIDVIRFLALEEIIVEIKPSKLLFVSSNREFNDALGNLCRSLNVSYEWKHLSKKTPWQFNLRCFFRKLPYPIQGIIRLVRHLFGRWALRRAKNSQGFSSDNSLFFCSCLVNFDSKLAEHGHFHSHFWEGMHDLMQKLGISGNWLQHYYPHDSVPTPEIAIDLVQRFNQQEKGKGSHTFIDSYLTWRIVYLVLKRWVKLIFISWRLNNICLTMLENGDSAYSLWPIVKEDWYSSMIGATSITNLLWIELFDSALGDIPHQKMGLFLCEYQSWEKAMIHAWRKNGHGKLIGVSHSTVRFWDLRLYVDPRTTRSSSQNPLPQPDLTALNGKVAVDTYIKMGYPKQALLECEALRYGYLNKMSTGSKKEKRVGEIKVLIFGDTIPLYTTQMLKLLEQAQPFIKVPTSYVIKPHPTHQIHSSDYPSLNLRIVFDPLGEILNNFDITYSANLTSASIDAYLAGLPVVVILNQMELNFSPLRGQPDVRFVDTPEKLAEAFYMTQHQKVTMPDRNDFFFLDPELPRWRRLLSCIRSD